MRKLTAASAFLVFLGGLATPAAALSRDEAWVLCAKIVNTAQYQPGDSRMTQAIEGCVAQKVHEPDAAPQADGKRKKKTGS
jgi:hypothetical protein